MFSKKAEAVPGRDVMPPTHTLLATGSSPRSRSCGRAAGFSVAEVMIAIFVFAVVVLGALTALQRGFMAVDTARSYSYAGQVMESEFERLRLFNWDQLQALQDSGDTTVAAATVPGTAAAQFACTRSITDLKTDMKQIVLTSTWTGHDGRPHTARLMTQYGKLGLYDYFYTAH